MEKLKEDRSYITKHLTSLDMGISKALLAYNQRKLRRGKVIDSLLNLISQPFYKKRQYPPIVKPEKILIIQSHRIGDVIMSTPSIRGLKEAYPEARIFLLANRFAEDLLDGLPYLDRIITMKFPWSTYDYSIKNLYKVLATIKYLRGEEFDLAIDLHWDFRNIFLMYLTGAKRRIAYDITGGKIFLTDIPAFPYDKDNLLDIQLSILKYLGIDCMDKKTELPLTQLHYNWVEEFIKAHKLDKERIVGIHPGASFREKRWGAEKIARVFNYLVSSGYQPVMIEGPEDEEVINEIKTELRESPVIVKTDLRMAAAFISHCRLLICMDSAAVHIAGAVDTPIIAIYGPQWPEVTKPFNENIEALFSPDFDCRPCEYGHCKKVWNSCMDSISSDDVISKIRGSGLEITQLWKRQSY